MIVPCVGLNAVCETFRSAPPWSRSAPAKTNATTTTLGQEFKED